MMVFMPLVLILIGQFCREVIGQQNMRVLVIGQLLFCLISRMGHVNVAVDIGSEVLVLNHTCCCCCCCCHCCPLYEVP